MILILIFVLGFLADWILLRAILHLRNELTALQKGCHELKIAELWRKEDALSRAAPLAGTRSVMPSVQHSELGPKPHEYFGDGNRFDL